MNMVNRVKAIAEVYATIQMNAGYTNTNINESELMDLARVYDTIGATPTISRAGDIRTDFYNVRFYEDKDALDDLKSDIYTAILESVEFCDIVEQCMDCLDTITDNPLYSVNAIERLNLLTAPVKDLDSTFYDLFLLSADAHTTLETLNEIVDKWCYLNDYLREW